MEDETTPIQKSDSGSGSGSDGQRGDGSGKGGQQAKGGGGGGEATASGKGKRRGRPPKRKEPSSEAASAVEGNQPRKREEMDALGLPKPCTVCGKMFSSSKALSSHMKKHPDRARPGVIYLPPITRPPSSAGRDIKQQEMKQFSSVFAVGQSPIGVSKEGGQDAATASGSQQTGAARRRGLDIDLNAVPVLSEPSSPENEAEDKYIGRNSKDDSNEGEGGKQ